MWKCWHDEVKCASWQCFFSCGGDVDLRWILGVCSCSWSKSIGLGFKTPQDAKEGVYIDKKCPWAGNVSIRGKLLRGVVVSTKMKRTIIIRRDYL